MGITETKHDSRDAPRSGSGRVRALRFPKVFAAVFPAVFPAVGRLVLDLFFPPNCALCHRYTTRAPALCTDCWQGVLWNQPCCARCAFPLPLAGRTQDNHCANCLKQAPYFDKLIAPLIYSEAGRKLLLGFKHGKRADHLAVLLDLTRAYWPNISQYDGVIPVPTSKWTLLRRGHNQAAQIGRNLCKAMPERLRADALAKVIATTQKKASYATRVQQVQRAYRVSPNKDFTGQTLLLVDDVATTGATLNACAKRLKAAGATRVDAFALCRTDKMYRSST